MSNFYQRTARFRFNGANPNASRGLPTFSAKFKWSRGPPSAPRVPVPPPIPTPARIVTLPVTHAVVAKLTDDSTPTNSTAPTANNAASSLAKNRKRRARKRRKNSTTTQLVSPSSDAPPSSQPSTSTGAVADAEPSDSFELLLRSRSFRNLVDARLQSPVIDSAQSVPQPSSLHRTTASPPVDAHPRFSSAYFVPHRSQFSIDNRARNIQRDVPSVSSSTPSNSITDLVVTTTASIVDQVPSTALALIPTKNMRSLSVREDKRLEAVRDAFVKAPETGSAYNKHLKGTWEKSVVSRFAIRRKPTTPGGARSASQRSDNAHVAQFSLNRAIRVLSRRRSSTSTSAAAAPGTKRRPCLAFARYGRCARGATCPHLHDQTKIAVCKRFVRGTCFNVNCPFLHCAESSAATPSGSANQNRRKAAPVNKRARLSHSWTIPVAEETICVKPRRNLVYRDEMPDHIPL